MTKRDGSACQKCGSNTGKVFGYPTLCEDCIEKYKAEKKIRRKKPEQETSFFGGEHGEIKRVKKTIP